MKKIIYMFILALLLATTPVWAVEIGLTGELAKGVNLGGTQVYFGDYVGGQSTGPIIWRVMSTGSGTAALWTTTGMGSRPYCSCGTDHHEWSGSDICAWLNSTAGPHRANYASVRTPGFLSKAFSARERTAIATAYGTANEEYGHSFGGPGWPKYIDSRQTIVLPSLAETGQWPLATDTQRFNDDWWLRSPGNSISSAASVLGNSSAYARGFDVGYLLTIRPAFKLNLSSVLLTSAADAVRGKNSATIGKGLLRATPPTQPGPVKLTVLDKNTSNLSLTCTDTMTRSVMAGDIFSISYSDAKTGVNKFVSCVIVSNSGTVLFYGKLATAESGIVSFIVPAALSAGSYSIRLFNEECNDDDKTDFAGTPIVISLELRTDGDGDIYEKNRGRNGGNSNSSSGNSIGGGNNGIF